MNELLGKLTNLSYELFGIIIPGAIITLFFAVWLASMGNIPALIISNDFPILTISKISEIIAKTFSDKGFGILIPLILSWYIFGHITQWFSSSTATPAGERASDSLRIIKSLLLKPPRPTENFSKDLKPLFDEVSTKLAIGKEQLSWVQFFPIAKNIIFRNSSNSLISTYQNKYTLHRSITIISAFLFWLDLAGIVFSYTIENFTCTKIETNTPLQLFILPFSVFLVWGFSGGYEYNWKMFGNTIVTETYSNLNFPKISEVKDEKPSGT